MSHRQMSANWRIGWGLLLLAITGCTPWIYRSQGMSPLGSGGEDYYKWPRYSLSKADVDATGKSLLRDLDWPLMVAINKETGPNPAQDCRTGNSFRCLLSAAAQRAPAYAYLTRMGTDSVYGWAAVARPDGKIVLFTYDSSPCGAVSPNGSCGFSLTYRTCDVTSELGRSVHRRQESLCEKPYFGMEKRQ